MYSYPLVRYTDMDDTMKKDVMEVCTLACERHTANNEMREDDQGGTGQEVWTKLARRGRGGFRFEISYEAKSCCTWLFAGSQAVCVWKCSY